MRLKRVRIFGFKTFADRTEFDLDGGLVAVVGSNGCGKSNLVDAILWGLGEGNSRQLRAGTGTDVIFNGSAKRKPIGFAEVTLFFDNEDGVLPIDSAEVSVTRRLTRSGDSEYRINKTVCRQRDVFELFADSGLGRAGYAIVGQREIDSALSASAEERRGWVDEAAGVQRYRARKTEAQRRLAAAKTHLERTADILRELEHQREPLRNEAEVAKRYKSVLTSLRQVETDLLMLEVVKAVREAAEHGLRVDETLRLSDLEAQRTEKIDVQIKATGEKISELEQEMDAIRSAQQGHLTAIERADADLRLAAQRLSSLDSTEDELGGEAETHAARIAEAEAEVVLASDEATKEAAGLESAYALEANSGEEAKAVTVSLKAIDVRLNEAKAHEAKRLRQAAEYAHRQDRIGQAKRELAGIVSSETDLAEAVTSAEVSEAEAKAGREEQQKLREAHEQAIRGLLQEEDQAAAAQRKALGERASLEGRIRGLEATLESHEGLSQGPRAVLDAAKRNILSGSYTPVGEAVVTDPEVALAIETALGGAVNDLIVDDETEAKEAIAWLKQNRAGRATFQPIPLMRVQEPGGDLLNLLRSAGVVGRAADLVKVPAKFRPVIESLLGRVVVTETLDDALQLARGRGRPFSRIVTLEGEVVNAGGAVSGGVGGKAAYGMVQRKADLERLHEELAKHQQTLAKAESETQRRSVARQELNQKLESARLAEKEAQASLAEAREFANALREEWNSAGRSKQRLERELASLESAHEEPLAEVDIAGIEAERQELLKTLATLSADRDAANARLEEARTRSAQAKARLHAAERRLTVAIEAEQGRTRKLEALGPERERLQAVMTTRTVDRDVADRSLKGAEQGLLERQNRRRELLEQSLNLAEEARAARDTIKSLADATHNAELNRARAESRRAAALARLMEEYGLNEEDALEAEPQLNVPDDAASVVSRLRRELKAMGDVNLGAIEAFDRLTERFTELEAQQEDILAGIADVEKSIAELDGLTREKFATTFASLQVAFSALFQRLFGGGEGRLELTDPSAMLESGIDLIVTLPGKKRQPLNLLSGGERSLCAGAFLFALLEVKSSPLVVLDEVDAPLDGVNVERFANLLKDFSNKIQFVVITHNPTTIAAAPVWLGVTMNEPGCSMLVPYQEKQRSDPARNVILA
jgi:chromosome segregation protein